MHTDEHTLHARQALMTAGRRRKRIQDLVLSISNQCNSVLIRGKKFLDFFALLSRI
jgi:hypothetical protein